MNKFKLVLLASPSLLAFILPVHSVHANTVAQPKDRVGSASAQPIVEIVFERPTPNASQPKAVTDNSDCQCSTESPFLDFTDEESTAAIQRYGCDCAGCVSAVRQLQGKLPLL